MVMLQGGLGIGQVWWQHHLLNPSALPGLNWPSWVQVDLSDFSDAGPSRPIRLAQADKYSLA